MDAWTARLVPILTAMNADPALHGYRRYPSRTGPYDIDARVRWKGLAWVSVAAANVSEPGTDANWIEFT